MNQKSNKISVLSFITCTFLASSAFSAPTAQEQIDALKKQVEALQKQLQDLTAQPQIQTFATTDTTDDPAKTGTGTGSIILNEGLDNTTSKKNTASGENAIVGGKSNTADGLNSAVIGGDKNTVTNSKNNNGIFAGLENTIDNTNDRNVIIGGQKSKITGTADRQGFDNVIIGGGDTGLGANEIIDNDNSTVIGGYKNVITGVADGNYQDDNIILGGHTNSITGTAKDSAILAGTNNTASGLNSVVVGGAKNIASGKGAVVLGGGFYQSGAEIGSTAAALNSSVVGGVNNQIAGTAYRSSIMGGYINNVSSIDSTVLGGHENTLNSVNSTILGGFGNNLKGANNNAIFVGESATIENVKDGNVIIGGIGAKISGDKSYDNFILGGGNRKDPNGTNEITNGDNNVVIGGYGNKITSDGKYYDNNIILGGRYHKIDEKTKNGFILGGTNNTVNGLLSGSLGGRGNNISGNGSYAIGGVNPTDTDSQSTDITYGNTVSGNNSFVMGSKNTISGNNSYALGNSNTIDQEKVYILGSNVDATGVANAVVLGDGSKAVANAVSVGTEAAPRNIKHVKDGVISDTSLDAINGSQVTTITEKGTVDDTYIAVERDPSKENGADPHISSHKKHYKIGLTADATTAITNAKKIPTMETNITNNTNSIANKADKNANNLTDADVTAWKTKLGVVADTKVTGLTLADTTLTLKQNNGETDLTVDLSSLKTDVSGKLEEDDINKITSSTLTITGGGTGDEANVAKGNVSIEIANGSIGSTQLDTTTNTTLAKVGTGSVASGNTNTVTGGDIYNAVSGAKTKVDVKGNYLTIDKTETADTTANEYTVGLDLAKVKTDLAKGSITGTGITVTGGENSTFEDLQLEITDKAVTKEKLSEGVQATLNQVTTNKTDIANNKIEIAKKVNTADMNGVLTSQSITVTGAGKDKLLKDVNIEVNKSLTGMQSISFDGGVTIGNNGLNNGGNKITNVATGTNPTDAVNVSQLQGATQVINDTINEVSDIVGIDSLGENQELLKTYNVDDQKEHITNNVVTAISRMNEEGIKFFHTNDDKIDKSVDQTENTVDSSAGAVYSTAIGYKARVTREADNSIAIGKESYVSGKNSIAIGTGHKITGDNSGAFGDPNIIDSNASYAIGNNNQIDSNEVFVLGNDVKVSQGHNGAVILGDKSTIDTVHTGNYTLDGARDGKVSGKKGKGTRIVSVGSKGDERQIQNVAPGVVSNSSTDAINGSQLYQTSRNLEKSANAGIAATLAQANLLQPYESGQSMVSAGVGHHKGESALSIGISSISDNGKWLLKGGVSINTNTDTSLGAGVGYIWK